MNPDVFFEAFLARLLPFYHEVTLAAIERLSFAEYPANAALAALGGILALGVYYGAGIFLRRLPERVSTEAQQARIETLRRVAREWLPWLLVLSPTPIGQVFVMAAGFFRLNGRLVWAVIVASEAVFRAMPYLRSL